MSIFLDYAKRAYNSIKHFSPLAIQRNLQQLSNVVGDLCESVDKFYNSFHEPVIVNAADQITIINQGEQYVNISLPSNYIPIVPYPIILDVDNVRAQLSIQIINAHSYAMGDASIRSDSQLKFISCYCEKR